MNWQMECSVPKYIDTDRWSVLFPKYIDTDRWNVLFPKYIDTDILK
jgi:hypothetical protein